MARGAAEHQRPRALPTARPRPDPRQRVPEQPRLRHLPRAAHRQRALGARRLRARPVVLIGRLRAPRRALGRLRPLLPRPQGAARQGQARLLPRRPGLPLGQGRLHGGLRHPRPGHGLRRAQERLLDHVRKRPAGPCRHGRVRGELAQGAEGG